MATKLITVFLATGKQGKSVAQALLASGYKVRALTRNPDGDGAQTLLREGCEVMKVDVDDKASLEKAIAGSYGVFAVSCYWAMFRENRETASEREVTQGKNIGDICKKEGVKHLVYSGMEHVMEIHGKSCPHYDGKAIVEKYLDEIKVPNTSIRLSFYYENFILSRPPKNEDGSYTMTWPMNGAMDTMTPTDLGPVVVNILNNPDKYIGKKIGLCGDRMTMAEYAAIISEVTGKKLIYNQVPMDVFAKSFPGAEDLAIMFEFYETGKCNRDAAFTRTLNPNTTTFRQWAEKNKDQLLAH